MKTYAEPEIRQLTPALAEDFFHFFEKVAYPNGPEWGCGCYCCFFHAENAAEWERRSPEQNREIAANRIAEGKMRGLLAYLNGVPVGWCHFGTKTEFPGLQVFYPEAAGGTEPGTGVVVCFTVGQEYRGRGIAAKLLARACTELGALGCTAVEAYPGTGADSCEENYRGPLGMYLHSGFSPVRTAGNITVVRKPLI